MRTQKLTVTALFVALGVLSAHLIYIPIGFAKCFPVQHAINVLLAVLLGTRYALGGAFTISLLRNLAGTGTLLAFPGSMFGAALSGILYKKTNHILGAVVGEIIGTGLIGSLAAYPIAIFITGSQATAFLFVVPFLISTTGGSLLAYLLYHTQLIAFFQQKLR